jgi:hypothetical protein
MDRSIAPVNATGRLKPALADVNMSRWRSAALGEAGRVGTAAAVLAGRIATDIARISLRGGAICRLIRVIRWFGVYLAHVDRFRMGDDTLEGSEGAHSR